MSADLVPLLTKLDVVLSRLLEEPQTSAASPWMTPVETCLYLRWVHETDSADHRAGDPNLGMFYDAKRRYGLPTRKVGGSLRCHRQFVEEWARTGVAVSALRAVAARRRG